jgi:hypothetical protein
MRLCACELVDGCRGLPASPLAARFDLPIEEWRDLDSAVLAKTRTRKVYMTCHWFRHHAGVNCIPLLLPNESWIGDGRQVLPSSAPGSGSRVGSSVPPPRGWAGASTFNAG